MTESTRPWWAGSDPWPTDFRQRACTVIVRRTVPIGAQAVVSYVTS
jgi:hypothetical protein